MVFHKSVQTSRVLIQGKNLTISKLVIIKPPLIYKFLILLIKSLVDFNEISESVNELCKTGTNVFSKIYEEVEYLATISLKSC